MCAIRKQERHTPSIERWCLPNARIDEWCVHTVPSHSVRTGTCTNTSQTATRRSIHWCKKLKVAANQSFRCAGNKHSCPRWKLDGGVFGSDAFEVDHIMQRSKGGNDDPENLQALCTACHAVRTRDQRIATCGRADTSAAPEHTRNESGDRK
jgi:5-methylcytosine-specific restriction endonuclease McrA